MNQGFDRLAWAYAKHVEVSVSNAGYERPALQKLIGPERGERVLDVGCGGGSLLAWLRREGAVAVGIDRSAAMVRVACARGEPAMVADMNMLPFADTSFDLVVSSLAMHYVEDWSVPLSEVRRVLRPGGELIFSTHHPVWDWGQLDPDDYFKEGRIQRQFHLEGSNQGMDVRFYRKTFSSIINSVAEYFAIVDIVEPQPQEWTRHVDPGRYEMMSKRPKFLLLRCAYLPDRTR